VQVPGNVGSRRADGRGRVRCEVRVPGNAGSRRADVVVLDGFKDRRARARKDGRR